MQKLFLGLALGISLISFQIRAAGPVMHVVLGEQWLKAYEPNYSEEEKKLFLLGTVFPDIRYLGVIKREQTHFADVTLKEILQISSPFKRGILFHSFVDEHRARLIQTLAIEDKIKEVSPQRKELFLKFLEDQILHAQFDFSEFRNSLLSIPSEEKAFDIPEMALIKWHAALALYFTALPSHILSQLPLLDEKEEILDSSTIQSWEALVLHYSKNEEMQRYVKNMLTAFEKLMENK